MNIPRAEIEFTLAMAEKGLRSETPPEVMAELCRVYLASQWQPIESAPKDGSAILLGYAGSHSEEGYWMGNAARNHWKETGWFSSDGDVLCEHPSHPTHWMPLPEAPDE